MIPISTFNGKDVAIFGLGLSGISTCGALAAAGARVHAWDDGESGRQAAQHAGFEPIDLREADWRGFAALVLAPGVPLTHPQPHWTVERARASGVEVIGDVELFARERAAHSPDAPFVAITGTNGKSTTTTLIAHILETAGRDAQMGGNIGVPILDLEPPTRDRIHVIELSSYQIDLMPSLKPSIGVLLNVSPDHLERHGSFENYAAIKARVPAASDFAIFGCDDETTRSIARICDLPASQKTMISSGRLEAGIGVADGHVIGCGLGSADIRRIADINNVAALRGAHNAQNAAAAAAVSMQLGLTAGEIEHGLRSFPGLPHRMEEICRIGRTIFINDSKATNAESTSFALDAFDREIYWIAGGLAKDGGIEGLAGYFDRIAKAYLIGAAAEAFAETLDGKCRFEVCETLAVATRMAAADAAGSSDEQPVVLLSPACASFDQFRSFEVRGNAFRKHVDDLQSASRTEVG